MACLDVARHRMGILRWRKTLQLSLSEHHPIWYSKPRSFAVIALRAQRYVSVGLLGRAFHGGKQRGKGQRAVEDVDHASRPSTTDASYFLVYLPPLCSTSPSISLSTTASSHRQTTPSGPNPRGLPSISSPLPRTATSTEIPPLTIAFCMPRTLCCIPPEPFCIPRSPSASHLHQNSANYRVRRAGA